MRHLKAKKLRGFTLIELLIVIAIILVLIAIALPNFLEAQIRARVTKVKSEFQTLETALTMYFNDWNWHYPMCLGPGFHDMWVSASIAHYTNLTTPVAYISDVNFVDPFIGAGVVPVWASASFTPGDPEWTSYYFMNYETWYRSDREAPYDNPGVATFYSEDELRALTVPAFALSSFGPSGPSPDPNGVSDGWRIWERYHLNARYGMDHQQSLADLSGLIYSPTNGTKSHGDILKLGGMLPADLKYLAR